MSFESLTSNIKGDVITPDHAEYDASLSRWAKNTERKAGLVVFVKDTEDVSAAISYARSNGLSIAVRGGGTDPFGKSSVEQGLVIDLSRHLNTVRVDAEKQLAYVGGGAIWKSVDDEAIKQGLATVGATVNHTGVGGVTLHGGYGWLSGRHGLAIDNLRQVTIVREDGSIVTANSESNEDIFKTVKTGGINFGVVTEFVLQLHPQRRSVYAGRVIFTPDKVQRLLETTKTWYENVKEDEGMIQIVSVSPTGAPVIATFLFFNGSEEEGRANFQSFFNIGPVKDDSGEIPYENANTLMNDRIQSGNSYVVQPITLNSLPDFPSTMQLIQKTGELEKGGQFSSYVLFQYFPSAKISQSNLNTNAATVHLPNVLALLKWSGESPEKSKEASEILAEFVGILKKGRSDEGSLSSFQQPVNN